MPHPPRITRRVDFVRASSKGKRAAAPGLVLQCIARDDALGVRAGFTVTKKVGNAVARNRARRRLREVARLWCAKNALPSVDLVLVGRNATGSCSFPDLQADFVLCASRVGLQVG
jgi:ribonuclease P protein component